MAKKGPLNDALWGIADLDKQIREHTRAPVVHLSEVRYLRSMRRDFVRTIEKSERGPTGW
jgi:hypothetical protein